MDELKELLGEYPTLLALVAGDFNARPLRLDPDGRDEAESLSDHSFVLIKNRPQAAGVRGLRSQYKTFRHWNLRALENNVLATALISGKNLQPSGQRLLQQEGATLQDLRGAIKRAKTHDMGFVRQTLPTCHGKAKAVRGASYLAAGCGLQVDGATATEREVLAAAKKINAGKALEQDSVLNAVVRIATAHYSPGLTEMFTECMRTSSFPRA
ncbi:hypothetical protein M0804_013485 [Polistes exclamans]|nr:hypothetical protein M0804_013485 [Polistes exclamans]